jgi:hypothetical protein
MKGRIDRIFHIVIDLCAFRDEQVSVEDAVTIQPQYPLRCVRRTGQAVGTATNGAIHTTQRNYTARIEKIRPKRLFLFKLYSRWRTSEEWFKNRTIVQHGITTWQHSSRLAQRINKRPTKGSVDWCMNIITQDRAEHLSYIMGLIRVTDFTFMVPWIINNNTE